jgi:hypothetical protein
VYRDFKGKIEGSGEDKKDEKVKRKDVKINLPQSSQSQSTIIL